MESSISFTHVHFGFKARPVLHDLSFTVQRGEFLAIVGPNGCGKSTALKLIAGLLRVQSGTVAVGGDDVSRLSRKDLSDRVAFLTQSSAPPPDLSVSDLVGMGRFVHQGMFSRRSREDGRQVDEALRIMKIDDLAGRRVGELSGGQLQRARMAMTLAQDSDALLLDEPTTYLDLRHQYGILEIARAQARAGKTVIAVLHDFTHASLYADRVLIMQDGRRVEFGEPNAVLTEDLVARVFEVQTHAVSTRGVVIHIPRGAGR